jgi:acetylornithine aminotransferase
MRAGLETIATIESEGLLENAAARGRQLLDGFRASLANCQGIREIRGQGLMIGIELDRPCGELVGQAREAGLLINVTADSVIRLLPALILNPSEAQQMVSILAPIIRQFLGARPA